MRLVKAFVFASITLFVADAALAQRAKKVTRSRSSFSAPKVRGKKAKIVCPVFESTPYPSHGLGFKLGDPFALTYKFYPNKRFSFALDIGKPAGGLYSDYFRGQFIEYLGEQETAAPQARYVSHRLKSDLTGELKILYHLGGGAIAEGLQFYAGAGWQWRTTSLHYDFLYNPSSPDPNQDPFGAFEYRRNTMGPQVAAGVEYSYFRIPVAAFLEIEYFIDTQADPGFRRFEGGVGLRYVF